MEILFRDRRMHKVCSEDRLAVKELGPVRAKRLRTRLNELGLAARVSELLTGRPHPLKGDRAHQFSVDLDGPMRLILEANDPAAIEPDGRIDWPNVTAVWVVALEDTHE